MSNPYEDPKNTGPPHITVRPVEGEIDHDLAPREVSLRAMAALTTGCAALIALVLSLTTDVWWLYAVTVALTLLASGAVLRLLRGTVDEAREEVMEELKRPVFPSKRSQRSMLEGEEVIWESRQHPFVLIKWFLIAAALQLATVMAGNIASFEVAAIIWLIGMSVVGFKVLLWERDRICVSKERIFATQGILTIKRPSMPLKKLTDVIIITPPVSTSLAWLRVIRVPYGTLDVESAGQDQALKKIDYVPAVELIGRIILGHTVR